MPNQVLESFFQELAREVKESDAKQNGGGCWARLLCLGSGTGSSVEVCEYADNEFEVTHVKNDEVELKLGYARTGSTIPESFHGIHWLDQYHGSSVAQDPEFQNDLPFKHLPSDEVAVAFGDAPTRWNADTRTLEQLPNYGGDQGHWTFRDTTSGKVQMQGALTSRMEADFVFDEAMEVVRLVARVRVPHVGHWISVPPSVFEMRMERRPWGWARITTVGPDLPDFIDKSPLLARVLPEYLMRILQVGEGGAMHYPVLQIVDGNGERTKYYDEYLKYINSVTNGSQVMGVKKA
mmetsp:Transcript_108886/g.307911  ORF Transcript_108886/g.307911 Transcript_108886/m.307911 type:complete len:293 (+) Transcript_108886:74-952(+)